MLERRSYRGEYVDIFSMGVILFLMVTGALPYTAEANINDALYKLIYQRKREQFWRVWREFNLSDEIQQGISPHRNQSAEGSVNTSQDS